MPARRVLPAQQRLHAQHGARGEVDQRLVVEPQLRALDRPPEVALERRPVDGLGVHLGIEQHRRAYRVRLRPMQRDLRLLEQVERMRQRGAPDRDPDAGPDGQLGAVQVERVRDGGLDPGRHALGLPHAADRPQQDPELVGAEAGHGVRGAGGRHQALANLHEQLIAGRVAQGLVDHLEPVQVEEDQGDPGPRRASPAVFGRGASHLLREPAQEHRPVGQAGQRVVKGGVGTAPDLGLRALEQAGVVEGDRCQLPEPRERLDLALREGSRGIARREADQAQDLVAGRERHRADRPEDPRAAGPARAPGTRRSRPRRPAARSGPPPSPRPCRAAAGSPRSLRTPPCRPARRGPARRPRHPVPRACRGRRA